jgi:hypothetical protein
MSCAKPPTVCVHARPPIRDRDFEQHEVQFRFRKPAARRDSGGARADDGDVHLPAWKA